MDKKKQRYEFKEQLTSEYLSKCGNKKNQSQFELVRHAIDLAENMILSGREPRVRVEQVGLNTANIVLEEIAVGKDELIDIIPLANEPVNVEEEKSFSTANSKPLKKESKETSLAK